MWTRNQPHGFSAISPTSNKLPDTTLETNDSIKTEDKTSTTQTVNMRIEIRDPDGIQIVFELKRTIVDR